MNDIGKIFAVSAPPAPSCMCRWDICATRFHPSESPRIALRFVIAAAYTLFSSTTNRLAAVQVAHLHGAQRRMEPQPNRHVTMYLFPSEKFGQLVVELSVLGYAASSWATTWPAGSWTTSTATTA